MLFEREISKEIATVNEGWQDESGSSLSRLLDLAKPWLLPSLMSER